MVLFPPRSKNVRTGLEPDGLVCPDLGPHSRKKLYLFGYYMELFTAAMQKKYSSLVYIDFFAGSGRGVFESGDISEGSPLIAARTVPKFTKIILCENTPENLDALKTRLRREPDLDFSRFRFFDQDCNEVATAIRAEVPRFSAANRCLTLAFVDPFSLAIDFATLDLFSNLSVDFLVLIADQMAGGRNLHNYIREKNETIEKFLGDPDWRSRWKEAMARRVQFRDFLLGRFTEKMRSRHFLPGAASNFRIHGKGVDLYHLAFFSKHPLALDLWEKAYKKAAPQEYLF